MLVLERPILLLRFDTMEIVLVVGALLLIARDPITHILWKARKCRFSLCRFGFPACS